MNPWWSDFSCSITLPLMRTLTAVCNYACLGWTLGSCLPRQPIPGVYFWWPGVAWRGPVSQVGKATNLKLFRSARARPTRYENCFRSAEWFAHPQPRLWADYNSYSPSPPTPPSVPKKTWQMNSPNENIDGPGPLGFFFGCLPRHATVNASVCAVNANLLKDWPWLKCKPLINVCLVLIIFPNTCIFVLQIVSLFGVSYLDWWFCSWDWRSMLACTPVFPPTQERAQVWLMFSERVPVWRFTGIVIGPSESGSGCLRPSELVGTRRLGNSATSCSTWRPRCNITCSRLETLPSTQRFQEPSSSFAALISRMKSFSSKITLVLWY